MSVNSQCPVSTYSYKRLVELRRPAILNHVKLRTFPAALSPWFVHRSVGVNLCAPSPKCDQSCIAAAVSTIHFLTLANCAPPENKPIKTINIEATLIETQRAVTGWQHVGLPSATLLDDTTVCTHARWAVGGDNIRQNTLTITYDIGDTKWHRISPPLARRHCTFGDKMQTRSV